MDHNGRVQSDRRRSLGGAISFVVAASVGLAIANFVALLWFARELGAAVMGTFAALVVIIDLISGLLSFGLNQAVIRKPQDDGLFNAAFQATLIQAIGVSLISLTYYAVIGPADNWIAFVLLLLSRLLNLFSFLLYAPLEARLEYRAISAYRLASSFVGLLTGICIVLLGFGLIGLAFREAVTAGVSLAIYVRWHWRRPGRDISPANRTELWAYSRPLWALNTLERICLRIDYALVGIALGKEGLGIYYSVRGAVEGFLGLVIHPIQTVVFSYYCRLRDAPLAAPTAFRIPALMLLGSLGVVFITLATTSIGTSVVETLFGKEFVHGGPLLAGFAIYGASVILFENAKALAMATHIHSKLVFARIGQLAALALLTMPLISHFGFFGAGLSAGIGALVLATTSITILRLTAKARCENK